MNLIVLPPKALGDAQAPPFLFMQNFERARLCIEIIFGDSFEHILREHHVSILVIFVRITVGVVDEIRKLIQITAFGVGQETRATVALLLGHAYLQRIELRMAGVA